MLAASKWFLPVIILGSSIVLLIWAISTRPVAQPSPRTEPVLVVDAIKAIPNQFSPSLTLYGTVESSRLMKAEAPGKGRVQTIYVKEGDRVTKDQLLLNLDERDFQLRMVQTEARVKELKAEIENARIKYQNDRKALVFETSLLELANDSVDRVRKLKVKGLVSDSSIDEALENLEKQRIVVNARKLGLNGYKSNLSMLSARLQGVQADYDLARLDFERSRIISPFDGFVADIGVSEGDPTKSNQLLLTLYSSESLEVKAMIPAPYQEEIELAIAENMELQAYARIGRKPVKLNLGRVAGQGDSRGIDAIFDFTEPNETIRIGRLIEINLIRPPHANAILIPRQAIYGLNRIYKITDNRLSSLLVEIIGDYLESDSNGGLLIKSSSIKAGDLILTSRLPNIIEGMLVTVQDHAERSTTE